MSSASGEITLLLSELELGRPDIIERLFPLVQHRLHEIAERLFRHERPGHTLQPTILVNDAFIRLSRCRRQWKDEMHFYAFAARNMRQILRDYGRAHKAQCRGRGVDKYSLEEARYVPIPEASGRFSALNEAFARLEELDPRQAEIMELRFLVGLSVKETAKMLGLGITTVKLETKVGKAFLRREVEELR